MERSHEFLNKYQRIWNGNMNDKRIFTEANNSKQNEIVGK